MNTPATFEQQILHNQRLSLALSAGMVVFALVLGALAACALIPPEFPSRETALWGAAGLGSLALVWALLCWHSGSRLIALASGARKIEPFEDKVLCNLVEEMALAAGLPAPDVYVIFDESPNAFASGWDQKYAYIAVTTGLRRKLNRAELQSVIAHEMAHIAYLDTRLMMLVATFAGLLVLFSDFFLRAWLDAAKMVLLPGRRSPAAPLVRPRIDLSFPLTLLALCIAWLTPLITKLLQLAISREREYLADATAIRYCRNPEALISALQKIAFDEQELAHRNRATEHLFVINPNPRRRMQAADTDSVWSTHPPLIKRISRLRRMARAAKNQPSELA